MITKARYFSVMFQDDFSTPSAKNILVFDNIGTINFIPLESFIPETILLQEQSKIAINIYEITNAAILYAVSQREGKEVGKGNFNGENIITALIKYMNVAIENKKEVALEIYQCWHELSQKLALLNQSSNLNGEIQQIVTQQPSLLPPLQAISDFPGLVHNTVFYLLGNFAQQIEENKKQFRMGQDKKTNDSKKPIKEVPLHLTYQRKPEDDELNTNQFYFYLEHDKPTYAVKNERGEVQRIVIESQYNELNAGMIRVLSGPFRVLSKAQKGILFNLIAKIHPDIKSPDADLFITANTGFIPLIQCLNYLTGNYFGKGARTELSVPDLLVRLDCYIDAYSVNFNKDQHGFLSPLQLQIQKELVLLSGQWMSSLKDYIDYELSSVLESCPKESLESATNNLLNNYDHYSDDKNVVECLSQVHNILKLNKKVTVSFITRDQQDAGITSHAFILGAKYALRQAAKNIKLILNPRAILNFDPYQYGFYDLTLAIHPHIEPFGINTYKTDLFEHVLLQLADITEFPTLCRYSPNEGSVDSDYIEYYETHFLIELNLSIASMRKLTNYLNNHYGDDTAELIPSGGKKFGCPFIKVHLATMMNKILPDWQNAMVNMLLMKKRFLQAYQVASSQSEIPLEHILQQAQTLGVPYKLTNQSHFLEALLLRAFNINVIPTESAIIQSDNRVDSILDIDFLMTISENAAIELTGAINQKFPEACARVIRVNVTDERKGIVHQQISIDKNTFISPAFQNHLSETLKYLVKNDAHFMVTYQIKSGTYQPELSKEKLILPSQVSGGSIFTQTNKDKHGDTHKDEQDQKNKCLIC